MENNQSTENLVESGSITSNGSVENQNNPEPQDDNSSELEQGGNYNQNRPRWMSFLGIFFTLITSSQMALCILIGKVLGKRNFHPFMIGFWEFTGNLFIIPLLLFHRFYQKKQVFSEIDPREERSNRVTLAFLLCLCFSWSCSTTLEFSAVRFISLADMSTIVYSSPVFVTIASHFLMGESFGIVSILCGFLTLFGVIVVTRPPIFTGETFDTDTLIGCGMAGTSLCLCVFSYTTLRRLRKVHYTVMPLFMGIWGVCQSTISASLISRFEFPNNTHDWLLVCGLMFFSFTPLLCLTLAFKFEAAGTVSLFRSFDIIFAFVWQYAFLGVVPDWISVLGGGIVIMGVATASCRKIINELPAGHPFKERFRFLLK